MDRGVWTAKTVKRPRQQPAHPQYANYWAPLTCKRHTMPHPAQPQHTNYWAPRTRKRHQQEHRPQRPTESSAPTQHAKGRTGDRPGPHKETTTRRNSHRGGRAPFNNSAPLGGGGADPPTPLKGAQGWGGVAWTFLLSNCWLLFLDLEGGLGSPLGQGGRGKLMPHDPGVHRHPTRTLPAGIWRRGPRVMGVAGLLRLTRLPQRKAPMTCHRWSLLFDVCFARPLRVLSGHGRAHASATRSAGGAGVVH